MSEFTLDTESDTESFFDLDALETGVEVSIEGPSHGAALVGGSTVTQYVEVAGRIKDLTAEKERLKATIMETAKPAFYGANKGRADLVTDIPVCDEEGTEIKLIAHSNTKVIPVLTTTGKPSPNHGVVTKLFKDNVDVYYSESESVSFSLDVLPVEERSKIRKYLAEKGIAIKRTLVPRECLNGVGKIPAGPDRSMTLEHQAKLEAMLNSRTFSLKTK